MSTHRSGQVDFLEELRLRRWARENYAPANERRGSWHPLVLDEMRRKDVELTQDVATNIGERFVPLEPTPLAVVHPAHSTPGNPNVQFDNGVATERQSLSQCHGEILQG